MYDRAIIRAFSARPRQIVFDLWKIPMKGENLDLSSDGLPGDGDSTSAPRRFLGIQFDCCGVYTRVYVNRQETAYEGNCPRCGRVVRLSIGPGGTSSRFFNVS